MRRKEGPHGWRETVAGGRLARQTEASRAPVQRCRNIGHDTTLERVMGVDTAGHEPAGWDVDVSSRSAAQE
jgi:hypothetical protein